ncbi:hypothetical protein JR316_0009080 [Psilocybe cubensis]|uniref:Uncharacterized protein n=2 Tax=Psilocybe cubensis TaxID=181762 RepID=A0ACB8GSA8_PSICU|nr:hypothetical protein JR316_0009080 [Psilocybe cubensis]KAH9478623.1 hypothetical protein JR316_0009080 [Psilocybe cubensis]
MSAELPLKIRVDIRDKWESPKGMIQKSIDDLEKTLGHKIVPEVQWLQLYDALKGVYPDKAQFIPSIARVVNAFYGRLLARVDDDNNSEWTEELLEMLAKKPNSSWLLKLEISAGRCPKVNLKREFSAFTLEIPNAQLPLNAAVESMFDQDLDLLFSSEVGISSSDAAVNDDDWAKVNVRGETTLSSHASTLVPSGIAVTPRIQKLPNIDMLDRPAQLFKSTAPYFLTVDARTIPLVIQGSHQPSLELLAEYLKKWAKTNMGDSLKRPILKVELVESAFVFGVIDGIIIEPSVPMRASVPLNPMLILAFVEGVLGYRETHTTGAHWVFKLEAPLR